MTKMTNTTFARNIGVQMAEYLNGQSAEAQNWRPMVAGDDIPTEDYVTLANHYGFNDMEQDEISEVERAYRAGFNETFVDVDA